MTHNPRERLAIIGSGASAIYLLKHLLDEGDLLSGQLGQISIFERSAITGMGMPYSPLTTDRFNMSNISSEELPELVISFADWLRSQKPELLKTFDLENVEITDSEVYSRLALGEYLNAQYQAIIARLAETGIIIREHPGCEVTDLHFDPQADVVTLRTSPDGSHEFNRVIIATGHAWAEEDRPEEGYYASPWPISKLLPGDGEHHNFAIGTLGASLSAFDVISSLAHRHGDFVEQDGAMSYHPHPGTEKFKIVMHSAQGLLPHLQFDQEEPFRGIYRHIGHEDLLSLVDEQGFLRLETFYRKVCCPVLREAFAKDRMPELEELLGNPDFSLQDFVEKMTDRHDYTNAFEGMRFEMKEAEKSVLNHQPIHWKEVLDDLMYTLNFHAGLMPAEDHLLLRSLVMPFLLNIVAAMPLNSGRTILALYDAGKLDLVSGNVSIDREDRKDKGQTTITVEHESKETSLSYPMFIDCSGQKPLQLEEYPFPSLVKTGAVRKARAAFANPASAADSMPEEKKEHLFQENGTLLYHIGGIDIDSSYRLTGTDGKANPRIYDIAFPHTTGLRPYSYGLQACSHTSAILVKAWTEEIKGRAPGPAKDDPDGITRIYELLEDS